MRDFPEDDEASRLENSLWLYTSHLVIDRYRKLISEMDKSIQ
jgi:hypothetical protein